MIDALVKLLEKLTELVKHRKEVEEKTFELLIKPLYTDLGAIHKDYLKMFEKCLRELDEGVEIKKIAKQLEFDRLELEPLRRSIESFIESYMNYPKFNDYRSCLVLVRNYLHDPNSIDGRTWSAGLSSILSGIPNFGFPARSEVLDYLEYSLKYVRIGWTKVSAEYAKLLVKVATG